MQLLDELKTLLHELESQRVEYALVGGLAVAVWGAPRATKDIDLLIRADALEGAMKVVARIGFDQAALRMTFRDGMTMQRMSKLEGGDILPVDLILVDPNLEPAWRSRTELQVTFGSVWVVSREALIAMKLGAARPQDIADVEKLRELDR